VFSQLIIWVIAGIILLLPLFFWMYVFSSFDHLEVSRKQFLIGLWAGALWTLPLIFNNMFILWNLIEEIFFALSFIHESVLGLSVVWSMGLFFLIMMILSLGVSILLTKKVATKKYIYSFLGLLWLLSISSILLYFLSFITPGNNSDIAIESGSFVFLGIAWVVSYYIIISLLEEWTKYISSLSIVTKKVQLSLSFL